MRIFDKNQDDDLNYQEFCDAFLPIDTHYANELAHKPPQEKYRHVDFTNAREMFNYRRGMFNAQTK